MKFTSASEQNYLTKSKQRGSWQRTEITSVLPNARTKIPTIFRCSCDIFRCISKFEFISLFPNFSPHT